MELLTVMLIARSTSKDNKNDLDNFEETYVEQLYNLCIENKYTKIVKYKKMTPITHKLQEIYANL